MIFHLLCDLTTKTKMKKKHSDMILDSNPMPDSSVLQETLCPFVSRSVHRSIPVTCLWQPPLLVSSNIPPFFFPTSKNKAKDFKFDRSGSWQKKLALMFQTLIYRIDIWEIEINVPSQRKGLNFGGLFPNELKNASGNKQGNTYKSRAWNR